MCLQSICFAILVAFCVSPSLVYSTLAQSASQEDNKETYLQRNLISQAKRELQEVNVVAERSLPSQVHNRIPFINRLLHRRNRPNLDGRHESQSRADSPPSYESLFPGRVGPSRSGSLQARPFQCRHSLRRLSQSNPSRLTKFDGFTGTQLKKSSPEANQVFTGIKPLIRQHRPTMEQMQLYKIVMKQTQHSFNVHSYEITFKALDSVVNRGKNKKHSIWCKVHAYQSGDDYEIHGLNCFGTKFDFNEPIGRKVVYPQPLISDKNDAQIATNSRDMSTSDDDDIMQ